MDIQSRLEALKTSLKRVEQAKTAEETRQQVAAARVKEIEAKMMEYDVSPLTIDREIDQLEQEITDNLIQVEGLIPQI
jgi:chromosome segregation ATPase